MAFDDDQALSLNLGSPSLSAAATNDRNKRSKTTTNSTYSNDLSLTLTLSGGGAAADPPITTVKTEDLPTVSDQMMFSIHPAHSYNSQATSSTPGFSSVKRERDEEAEDKSVSAAAAYRASLTADHSEDEDEEGDVVTPTHRGGSSYTSNSNTNNTKAFGVRKKLRLNKSQSEFLEQRFKQNNTLNPKQKQALADQLNLRPRQIEVWFQNRRARTKLKQTEADYELLKKCCETLKDENRRLHNELQELRATTTATAATPTLSLCPSCERASSSGGHPHPGRLKRPTPASFSTKSRFFTSPFGAKTAAATSPSAGTAC